MPFKQIPLCYFPTTVVLIDDNAEFTKRLSLFLAEDYICHIFNKPQEALTWLQAQAPLNLLQQLTSNLDEVIDSDQTQEILSINLDHLHHILYDAERFLLPTVSLIDYAMPFMSGFELCQHLQKHPIRKIMLTGNATEIDAVQGFNADIIHRFFLKNLEDKPIEQLKYFITEQQVAYFAHLSKPYYEQLPATKMIIETSEFSALFHQIVDDHAIVEFYLLDKWGSYLMLDAQGHMLILAMCDAQMCETYYQIASLADIKVDPEIFTKLSVKSHFPFFYKDYTVPPHEWGNYLCPSQPLGNYYYSLILHDKIPLTFKRKPIKNFKDYSNKTN